LLAIYVKVLVWKCDWGERELTKIETLIHPEQSRVVTLTLKLPQAAESTYAKE
jgi:hypothetical protein